MVCVGLRRHSRLEPDKATLSQVSITEDVLRLTNAEVNNAHKNMGAAEREEKTMTSNEDLSALRQGQGSGSNKPLR